MSTEMTELMVVSGFLGLFFQVALGCPYTLTSLAGHLRSQSSLARIYQSLILSSSPINLDCPVTPKWFQSKVLSANLNVGKKSVSDLCDRPCEDAI